MPTKKNARKYLVKTRQQGRYIFYYLSVLIGTSSILAVCLYRASKRALRLEMFRGHSAVRDTWEVLRPVVTSTDLAATAALIVGSIAVTLLVTWMAHRASMRLIHNLAVLRGGGDPATLVEIGHPSEFRHLQLMLIDALRLHRNHMDEIRHEVEALMTKVRKARGEWDQAGWNHAHLRGIHVRCERLKHELRRFRLE